MTDETHTPEDVIRLTLQALHEIDFLVEGAEQAHRGDDPGITFSELLRQATSAWKALARVNDMIEPGVSESARQELLEGSAEVVDELARRAFLKGAEAAASVIGVVDVPALLTILASIDGRAARYRATHEDLAMSVALPKLAELAGAMAEQFGEDVEFLLTKQRTDADRVHAVREYFRTPLATKTAALVSERFFGGAAAEHDDDSNT